MLRLNNLPTSHSKKSNNILSFDYLSHLEVYAARYRILMYRLSIHFSIGIHNLININFEFYFSKY